MRRVAAPEADVVRVLVETPSNLTSGQRKLLEELGETFKDRPTPSRQSFLSKIKDLLK